MVGSWVVDTGVVGSAVMDTVVDPGENKALGKKIGLRATAGLGTVFLGRVITNGVFTLGRGTGGLGTLGVDTDELDTVEVGADVLGTGRMGTSGVGTLTSENWWDGTVKVAPGRVGSTGLGFSGVGTLAAKMGRVDAGRVVTVDVDAGMVEAGWLEADWLEAGGGETGRMETRGVDGGGLDPEMGGAGGVHWGRFSAGRVEGCRREVTRRVAGSGALATGGFAGSLRGGGGRMNGWLEEDEGCDTEVGESVGVDLGGGEGCTEVWSGRGEAFVLGV